jgi:uncharacterized membrane protein YeiH
MLDSVVALADPHAQFGLLDMATFQRSAQIIGLGIGDPRGIAAAAKGSWTHTIWTAAGLDIGASRWLTPAVRHYLSQVVGSGWFHALGLIGTVTFALSGMMQAIQRRYDLWGAFILTLLPPCGGGMLRDLLIGGDRHPPFVFKDPIYISLVFAVFLFGLSTTRLLSERAAGSPQFNRAMVLFDTVGLATFTVTGAVVPLMAGLGWWWMPFCAGLTVAGGGMILDIVTSREPRTFQGELYEEIAAVGGLLLFGMLLFANRHEHAQWLVTAAIGVTWALVFCARLLVVRYGIRSYRLGGAMKATAG